jgi:hypothetical protein
MALSGPAMSNIRSRTFPPHKNTSGTERSSSLRKACTVPLSGTERRQQLPGPSQVGAYRVARELLVRPALRVAVYFPARRNLPVLASITPMPLESLAEEPKRTPHTSSFLLASQSNV